MTASTGVGKGKGKSMGILAAMRFVLKNEEGRETKQVQREMREWLRRDKDAFMTAYLRFEEKEQDRIARKQARKPAISSERSPDASEKIASVKGTQELTEPIDRCVELAERWLLDSAPTDVGSCGESIPTGGLPPERRRRAIVEVAPVPDGT